MEPLFITGGNAKWFSYYGKPCGKPSNNYTELPSDSAIPVLGVNPKESKIGVHVNTSLGIATAALFTTVKTWKQPICPLASEWI